MRRNMCMCMMCVLQFFSLVTVFTRRTWYPSVPPPGISSELQDPPILHSPTKGHGYKAYEVHKKHRLTVYLQQDGRYVAVMHSGYFR